MNFLPTVCKLSSREKIELLYKKDHKFASLPIHHCRRATEYISTHCPFGSHYPPISFHELHLLFPHVTSLQSYPLPSFQVKGRVIESLPNAMFRVEIEPSKQLVLATISGKIRKNSVRIVVGDSVECELSAYDLTRGRITYRNK